MSAPDIFRTARPYPRPRIRKRVWATTGGGDVAPPPSHLDIDAILANRTRDTRPSVQEVLPPSRRGDTTRTQREKIHDAAVADSNVRTMGLKGRTFA